MFHYDLFAWVMAFPLSRQGPVVPDQREIGPDQRGTMPEASEDTWKGANPEGLLFQRISEPHWSAKELNSTTHHNRLDSSSATSPWLLPNKAHTQKSSITLPQKCHKASTTLFQSFLLESWIDRYWIEGRRLNIQDHSWPRRWETQPALPWMNQCSTLGHYCISGWLLFKK